MDNIEERLRQLQDEVSYWQEDLKGVRDNIKMLEQKPSLTSQEQFWLNNLREAEKDNDFNVKKSISDYIALKKVQGGNVEVTIESRKRVNDTDSSSTSNKRKN
jgi:prefoldin subunit 5